MSDPRSTSSFPSGFAPVAPATPPVVGGGSEPSAASPVPASLPPQQVWDGLLQAVTRLTILVDQRLPAAAPTAGAPAPASLPSQVGVAQTPPPMVSTPPGPTSPSPVRPHPADLTLEALGAGHGLYLYTPSVKIPLAHFPGHRILYRYVQDFVSRCPVCQKDRLGMTDTLPPLVRHLKPLHHRSIVGVKEPS